MFYDARALAPNAALSADVCIVGAGAAGITLALGLRDAGLSVCVLESGGFEISDANQALYQGRMSGIDTWALDKMRVRAFGGTTAWWAGYCRPLDPEDFEARPYIPDSGWPFGYDDLEPYYARACDLVEIGELEFDPVKLAARSGRSLLPFDQSVLETRVYRLGPPTRFGTRYRAELDGAEDIHVYLNANLRHVRLTQRRGLVSHLECATREGGAFTVEASRYVLALGGVENARMLLASNADQPEGVANGSGRVGEFSEHPHLYGSGAIAWTRQHDLGFYLRHRIDATISGRPGTVDLLGGIALSRDVRESEGLPNFMATLDPVPMDNDTGALSPTHAAAVVGRKAGAPSAVRLTYRCEQTITPDSRIRLMQEVDALGIPRIDLHWAVRDEDRRARRRSFALMARELGRLGLGRLWDKELAGAETVPAPGGHHLGTTRMSVDPAKGVVDANSRAHDVENLYITGGSVFPSGGDANPTLTIVALAHRLADHLRGEA